MVDPSDVVVVVEWVVLNLFNILKIPAWLSDSVMCLTE